MALYRLCYERVSTEVQNTELQRAYFEAAGYDEIFSEKISGRREDRPQFLRLVARALELREVGHDVVIYVFEWTRWARKAWFALQQLEKLETAGVNVIEITTKEPVSMRTPDAFINVSLKSLLAEDFSRRLSDRITRAHKLRRSLRRPQGFAPFGYQLSADKTQLEPGPQWAIAREIVNRFLAGESWRSICDWLGREHGIHKSRRTLGRWILSPVLRGHLNYHRSGDGIAYDCHEPLITEAEYREIAQRIDTNRRLRGANAKATRHAVPTGLVVCAHCHRKMNANQGAKKKKGGSSRYFRCLAHNLKNHSCTGPFSGCRDDWIEAAIQNEIQQRAEKIAEWLEDDAAPDPRLAEMERKLGQLQALADVPGVLEAIAGLEEQIRQIKTASERKAASAAEKTELILDLNALTPEDWAMLTSEQRRNIYLSLVQRVVVSGAEILEVVLW